MAKLVHPRRALSTNPLKSSAPLGAALAYLGIEGAIPLFHGSQGCTAFAMVHLVRHFKEAVPLQTTAMNEVSTILGGADQIEEAIENLRKKSAPKFIGIASTALTETRGEDVPGELREIICFSRS
jgi:nitrogenase molybdenum-iron protein NifN